MEQQHTIAAMILVSKFSPYREHQDIQAFSDSKSRGWKHHVFVLPRIKAFGVVPLVSNPRFGEVDPES